MAQLQLQRPIAFFDLETTGVDAAKDRIVEIAVIKLMPDGTRVSWVKRINPTIPIPAETSAIHGIFDADKSQLQKIPENTFVSDSMVITDSKVTKLPKGLKEYEAFDELKKTIGM